MTFTGRRQTKNDDQKTPKIIELRELNNETLGKLYALRVLNNQSRSSCSFFLEKPQGSRLISFWPSGSSGSIMKSQSTLEVSHKYTTGKGNCLEATFFCHQKFSNDMGRL